VPGLRGHIGVIDARVVATAFEFRAPRMIGLIQATGRRSCVMYERIPFAPVFRVFQHDRKACSYVSGLVTAEWLAVGPNEIR